MICASFHFSPTLHSHQDAQAKPHDQHHNGVIGNGRLFRAIGVLQQKDHIVKIVLALLAAVELDVHKVVLVGFAKEGELTTHHQHQAEQGNQRTAAKHIQN